MIRTRNIFPKKFIFFLTIFLVAYAVSVLYGQQNFADSLKKLYANAENDTMKAFFLSELALKTPDSEWPAYNKQLLEFCEDRLNRKQTAREQKTLKKFLAIAFNNKGFLAKRTGDIYTALEYYHKSLKLCEEIGNKKESCLALNNIGRIYNDQHDSAKTIQYFIMALKAAEDAKDKRGFAASLVNLGGFSQENGDTATALKNFRKAHELQLQVGDLKSAAKTLKNIGMIYDFQGRPDQASEYYAAAREIQERLQDKQGLANTLIAISHVQMKRSEPAAAKKTALLALKLSMETGFPQSIASAAHVLVPIYKSENNFSEALRLYELETKMRDSLNNDQNKKIAVRKQFQYEYEKRAASDSVKNAETQKVKDLQITAQAANLRHERNLFWFAVTGLVLVSLGLFFAVNRFMLARKQKKIIHLQKTEVDTAFEQLHQKNSEVMDSIRYAKKIQTSLLASETYIHKHLMRLR